MSFQNLCKVVWSDFRQEKFPQTNSLTGIINVCYDNIALYTKLCKLVARNLRSQ